MQFTGIDFETANAARSSACALVALAACERHGATTLYDLPRTCGLRIGALGSDGYKPCGGPRRTRSGRRTGAGG